MTREGPPLPARWVRACGIEVFEERAVVPVLVEDVHLVLVRQGERVFAAERACPHEGADLAQGRCGPGRLFCPRHLAWFDLCDGTVRGGWAFRKLRLYPAKIVGAEIRIDAGALRG